MENLTGLLLLLAVLNFTLAQYKVTEKYFKDGGQLTMDLRPRPPEPLINIVWKFQGNLVAEWVKDKFLTYYRTFSGRTTLELTTGRLVIINMTKADIGVYSVEVNNEVQNVHYNALLMKEVPQPEIGAPETCSPDLDTCTLVCEANITDTTAAGPVTYSWKKGDGEWKESGKDLNITKNGTLDVKTFTCRIQNPVSQRDSGPRRNPILKEERERSGDSVMFVVVVTTVLFFFFVFGLVMGVSVVVYLKGNKKGPFKNRGGPGVTGKRGPPTTPGTSGGNTVKTREKVPLNDP